MARKRAFENGKAIGLNERSVGVLRDGQDDAIALPRRLPVMMILVAGICAIGVLVSLDVSGVMLGGRRKLLEQMMHPMWRGGGEKKTKCGGHAQV